ncbi:MAG: RsmE family RNA methyltransferase [Patescibacteria group bacterium]
MRLHNFFVEEKLNNKKEFETNNVELIHQWKNVFRLKVGDRVILLDNSGFEFYGTISLLSKNRTIVLINGMKENIKPKNLKNYEVHFYVSLIKKNNFELILEKGTELGVTRFVPIISDRSEKKDFNKERAEKIIKEASEQSGRGFLPTLMEVVDLKNMLRDDLQFIAFHLVGEKFKKNNFKEGEKIGVLIGPEGGWTDGEINFFKKNNIPVVFLGPQVLRSETAAISVSSLLLL